MRKTKIPYLICLRYYLVVIVSFEKHVYSSSTGIVNDSDNSVNREKGQKEVNKG